MFRPVVEFTPPAKPEDMTRREHNRYVKQALREALSQHWKKNTRRHFQIGAAARYNYRPRSRKYLERKRRQKGHMIPMLYSGATRAAMSNNEPSIAIGGAAEGGKKAISGGYKLRFPWNRPLQQNFRKRLRKYGNNRQQAIRAAKPNVTRQLKLEMERWAGEEVTLAKETFFRGYMERVDKLRARRKRRRTIKA